MNNTPLSKTLFYAPVWTNDFARLCKSIKADPRFNELEKDNKPQYFLPYVINVYNDAALYRAFELKEGYLPDMCMYKEYLGLSSTPKLDGIKIHCFASGCAFVEFSVIYNGLSISEIENFSYEFKKATKCDKENGYTLSICDVVFDLFIKEKPAELYFAGEDFKQECRMFHQIYYEKEKIADDVVGHLKRLARGYRTSFVMPNSFGDYDMVYTPYDYDCWAGSQEGIVNLFSHSGDADADYYIDYFKEKQLSENYVFMYLLLLNQRFSAVRLISDIIECTDKPREMERINKRISELKTVFAFNIVSDDQVYQNVYNRMYRLMDIDRLLDDIRDNEQQAELIQKNESLKSEKRTEKLLVILSAFSVFSVLIDSASFFDRFLVLRNFSSYISIGCLVVIVVIWCIMLRKR